VLYFMAYQRAGKVGAKQSVELPQSNP
jgi:hypothetical protein